MPGDKITVTIEASKIYSWTKNWSYVLEVFRIEQYGNYNRLWIKNNGRPVYFPITENGCYYGINDINRHRNIQLFNIIELAEDK
jgi:hypothetical protein